jgi:lysophospholipase L1-like esterase
MPFGESTTTGVGTTESGGYRVPLIRKLWAANQKFTFVGPLKNGPAKVDGKDFPVNHAGFSGHTIENSSRTGISEKAIDLMKTYKPHVVTLMIGGNDVDIKNNLDDAPNRLAKLMDKILTTNPDTLLIVAKMVPATNDDFNVLAKAYYEGIDRVAKVRIDGGKHVVVVDMPTPMMSKPDWKKALYFDRLHPNDAGCAVEADVWYEALKNIFR